MKRLSVRTRAGVAIVAMALATGLVGTVPASAQSEPWGGTSDDGDKVFFVTSTAVTSETLKKSSKSKVSVKITYTASNNSLSFTKPYVKLTSQTQSSDTYLVPVTKTSTGVLAGSFYVDNDTTYGSWLVATVKLPVKWSDGDTFLAQASGVEAFSIKRNTLLSANAGPEPVLKGKSITVSGTLQRLDPGKASVSTDATYVPYAARSVKVYFDPTGSAGASYMGAATTNASGTYSKKFTAKADGRWFVKVASTSKHGASESGKDYVDVL